MLAIAGVIVVAIVVIALSVWLGKSRKRDLDRAMGKTAPDDKRTRDAKAAADARLTAEAEAAKESEKAGGAAAGTAATGTRRLPVVPQNRSGP